MTQMDAMSFVDKQVKPRMFGGKMDEAVESDWIRCLQREWVKTDIAKQAIQNMVDSGSVMKVSSFYKAYKSCGGVKIAEQGKPVCLFGILPERHVERYNDPANPLKECLIKWFYTNHPKYVPNPQKMAEQAAYWSERLKGRIIYADGFGQQEDPF